MHIENRMSFPAGNSNVLQSLEHSLQNLRLLLADEPTGNLDTQTASEVFELFRKVNKEQGCAILLVTHDPRLSVSCDRTIKLVDGFKVIPEQLQQIFLKILNLYIF